MRKKLLTKTERAFDQTDWFHWIGICSLDDASEIIMNFISLSQSDIAPISWYFKYSFA